MKTVKNKAVSKDTGVAQSQYEQYNQLLENAIHGLETFVNKLDADFTSTATYFEDEESETKLARLRDEFLLIKNNLQNTIDAFNVSKCSPLTKHKISEYNNNLFNLILLIDTYLEKPTEWLSFDSYLKIKNK
jgi:hypothetical protein